LLTPYQRKLKKRARRRKGEVKVKWVVSFVGPTGSDDDDVSELGHLEARRNRL
jgi:hypothetical protein